MKIWGNWFFALFLLVGSQAWSFDRDTWLYTVSSAFLVGEPGLELGYTPKKSSFRGQEFSYGLHEHAGKNAPLVVVIPGFGKDHKNDRALYLTSLIHKFGYHVVTFDSPFDPGYITKSSASGVPGIFEDDRDELYSLTAHVVSQLRKNGLQFTDVHLCGYSMGAVNAAYMRDLDQRENKVGFQKTILINPAFDLEYGMAQLDQLIVEANQLWKYQKARALAKAAKEIYWNKGQTLHDAQVSAENFIRSSSMTDIELKYLVAYHFGEILGSAKAAVDHRTSWSSAIVVNSFWDFLEQITFPTFIDQGGSSPSLNQFLADRSLSQVLTGSLDNPYVFHNKDDFLLRSEEFDWLQNLLGSRAHIFPYGGHMGNIWELGFIDELDKAFAEPITVATDSAAGF